MVSVQNHELRERKFSTEEKNMKMPSRILFLLVLFGVALGSGCIVYSTDSEKIIKVADFPDKPEFQREVRSQSGIGAEKIYIDAGYTWSQTTFFWCPIYNGTGKYVGHIGSDTKYLPLEPAEMKELAAKAQITFFGILIVVILLFIGWSILTD
jgi:hypothetical protein